MSRPRMAVNETELFIAPLHDADCIGRTADANAAGGPKGEPQGCGELHRSAKREQGAHVRGHGWPTKSAGTADLNATGDPERKRRASHRDVASSSRRPAWREKRRGVSATRGCRNRRARRNGFGHFCRNKSGSPAQRAKPLFASLPARSTVLVRTFRVMS